MKYGIFALLAFAASFSVSAGVLYDNGPVNGTHNAYSVDDTRIYFSNSFTLSETATVSGIALGTWTNGNGLPQSLHWTISAKPLGQDLVAEGDAALSNEFLRPAGGGFNNFDVFLSSFNVPSTTINAGKYWLSFTNFKQSRPNYFMGWDINFGPSEVSPTNYGPYSGASNSFQIMGVSAVPEPSTYFLMLFGLALLISRVNNKK